MDYADEIAQHFKKRDNPKTLGAQVGTVQSTSPLRVSILDGRAILDSDDVLIARAVIEGSKSTADIKISGTTNSAEITWRNVLAVGDMVLCVPAGAKFVIVDKVV